MDKMYISNNLGKVGVAGYKGGRLSRNISDVERAKHKKDYQRKWYQEHKEELREKRREYLKEYAPKWREKNRDKYNAYAREWRAKRKAKEEML